MRKEYKAVIFDLDGTLIDNLEYHLIAWVDTIKKYEPSYTKEKIIELSYGKNNEIVRRFFGDQVSTDLIHQISVEKESNYRMLYSQHVKLINGWHNFATECKSNGILIGLGTAAPEVNVEFIFSHTGVKDMFDIIVDAEQVQKGKPDPEVFLTCAGKFNVSPEDCLVFEDSFAGISAAINAGMDSIHIRSFLSETLPSSALIKASLPDYEGLKAENGYVSISAVQQ